MSHASQKTDLGQTVTVTLPIGALECALKCLKARAQDGHDEGRRLRADADRDDAAAEAIRQAIRRL